MTQAHKTPGNLVKVKDKCFEKNTYYSPHYDYLKDHVFEFISVSTPDHVLIKCLSGLIDTKSGLPLQIGLHTDEIQTLSLEEKHTFEQNLRTNIKKQLKCNK